MIKEKIGKLFVATLMLFTSSALYSQSVGVVLSGGGAKGLYHVGVIKALEENDIPIDYIAGTSMGAIIAGMYASGLSADDMIEIFTTGNISQWLSSDLEDKYLQYYNKDEVKPSLFSTKINYRSIFKRNNKVGGSQLTSFLSSTPATGTTSLSSIIPTTQLDIQLMEYFAAANSHSGGDFNKLFVPFRCVAADVVTKKEYTWRKGNLAEAVRSSMAIPIIFTPVIIDKMVLYDGGVYNNFPWRNMIEEFNPDIVIGSVCVRSNNSNNNAKTIADQVELMVMQPTEYNMPEEVGVLLGGGVDIGLLDYDNPMPPITQGYHETIARIKEIKERVRREAPKDEVERKRMSYKATLPALKFSTNSVDMLYSAATSTRRGDATLHDTLYIDTSNRIERNDLVNDAYSLEDVKSAYYRTVIDRDMQPNFPIAEYNPKSGLFDLNVKMTTTPTLRLQGGLNISSSSINQAFLGLVFKDNKGVRGIYSLDGYLGSFYSSVQFNTRHTYYNKKRPFYFENNITYNYIDYARANNQSISFNSHFEEGNYASNEIYISSALGIKMLQNGRAVVRGSLGREGLSFSDKIMTDEIIPNDKASINYANISLTLDGNSLNYQAYATEGRKMQLSGSFTFAATKIKEPAYDIHEEHIIYDATDQWFGLTYNLEHYIKLNKHFSLGYNVSGMYSNIPYLGSNYVNRAITPRYTPTEFTKTLFLPEFQDDSHIGLGVMPIVKYNSDIYIKGGFFLYKPDILKYNNDFIDDLEYITSIAAVYQSPLGPIALTYTNFSASSTKKNYLIFSFGYMLFNKKGITY